MEIDIAKLRIAVAQSKTRKEIPIKYGIISTPYIEYVLSKLIIDNKIDVSHLDKKYCRTDYSKPENLQLLKDAIEKSSSMAQLLFNLGKNVTGGSIRTKLIKVIKENNLDISKFTGQAHNKGKVYGYKHPVEDYLSNKRGIQSHDLRLRLIEESILKNKCSECSISDWNGKEISLQLDHIDGNHFNNNLINLRILCASCHAKTDNFRGKNIGLAPLPPLKIKETSKELLDNKAAIELQLLANKASSIEELLKLQNKDPDDYEKRKYLQNLIKRYGINTSHFIEDKVYFDKLKELVPICNSYHEILQHLDKCPNGGNYPKIKRDINTLGLSIDHFNTKSSVDNNKEISIHDVLTNKINMRSHQLHKLIIKYNLIDYHCKECNEVSNLELEHRDGNNKNNNLDNLEFLCPNCHSQTDTYAGKNKGKINGETTK